MKATEQHFPVVLLIMLYNVVLTLESVDKICQWAIHMKAAEQYFSVVVLNSYEKDIFLRLVTIDISLSAGKIAIGHNGKKSPQSIHNFVSNCLFLSRY